MPKHPTTPLTHGLITNDDEITVILIEPPDGTPALVRVHWPLRPTTAAATHYPAVAAAIVQDHRRERDGTGTTQGGRTMSTNLKVFALSVGGLLASACPRRWCCRGCSADGCKEYSYGL